MKNRTIWVTGSSGFIGRHLVAELKDAGFETECFSNALLAGRDNPEIDYLSHPVDYLKPASIKKQVDLFGLPDIFIHLGWGDMAQPGSDKHLGENVKAGETLIGTMFRAGLKKFVFVGSMNEYGVRTGLLSENMEPLGRLTNYAKGKIEVAKFGFQSAKTHGKTFIHARPFYVFGSGQRQGSLINDLYQSYVAGTSVDLSPCEHYRDYIHVSEVAEGLRRACDVDESTIVNLGSGTVVKVRDFVLLFWKVLNGDAGKLRFGARQLRKDEPEQPKSYADLERLMNLIRWKPKLSLEDGIKLTIRGLNKNNG